MVMGKIALERLLKSIRGPEGTLGREINPSLYDLAEVKRRVRARDPFIVEVLTGQKIMLIGDEDGLPRTAWQTADKALQGIPLSDQKPDRAC